MKILYHYHRNAVKKANSVGGVASSSAYQGGEHRQTFSVVGRSNPRQCDNLQKRSHLGCRGQLPLKPVRLPAADSRVLRKGTPRTPPGPEGSNGTGLFPVPQARLAIIRRASD
jgi:hypothetical protein